MTNNYNLKPLTQVCEVLSGGTPKTTVPEFWNGNIPWASVKDFNIDSRWFSKTEKSISQLGLDSCSSVLLEPGDLVISARGTVGALGQCKMRTSFNQSNYGLRAKNDLSTNDYLYYALSYAKQALLSDTHGGMFDTITRDTLDRLLIPIPTLKVQEKIAEILGSLDMKIAINNALSKTLEDIAQTIFKSWFIDFDPVKAKMAREKPAGMDAATAALFPDSMEESELGMIPKGWMVSNLESISSVKFGAPFASKLFNTLKVGQPLIRIRDLKKQSISTWSPENHPKGFLVSGGELLVGMDGEFNPTIWFGEVALVNQRICKIEPKDFVSNFFLYFTLVPIMRKIEHGSTGSTVIHLGKTDIDAIKISVPSSELLSAFKSLVEPLLKQMVSLNVQVRVLQEARDALLPRLISGELQIPEDMLAS